ncbi:MAG: hypothetical protein K2G89_00025, partial [Lachnospiraceae bacterium]|nr:hypothetical protein [Lachnospiraceae bacterium]
YGSYGHDRRDVGTCHDYRGCCMWVDIYLFFLGDGYDTIADLQGGNDRLIFGEGIRPADIEVSGDARSIYLKNRTNGDCVKLADGLANANNFIKTILFADGTQWGQEDLKEQLRKYQGTAGDDTITAYDRVTSIISNDDFLYGGDGNDTIAGGSGNDEIYGEAGDDSLYGGDGNDWLYGGTGNDYLEGGSGDDTYLFSLGDGYDTIADFQGGNDRLLFGEGIRPGDMEIISDGKSVYLKNRTNGDCVKLEECLTNPNNFIKTIQFADGTQWDASYVREHMQSPEGEEAGGNTMPGPGRDGLTGSAEDDELCGGAGDDNILGNDGADRLFGGSGQDFIQGGSGSDFLYGESGDDRLYGGDGDDTLDGGTGKDNLYGGAGNDMYFFHAGDGQDTITDEAGDADKIVFGEGIAPEDIDVTRDANSLYLKNRKTGDQVMVENCFRDDARFVESVAFADGTEWDEAYLRNAAGIHCGTEQNDILRAYGSEGEFLYGRSGSDSLQGAGGDDVLYGQSGDDWLYAYGGDDTLDGGTGKDNLYGGAGNDTYFFHAGDGQDTIIEEAGDADKIVFGEGIAPEDIDVTRDANSLYLKNRKTGDQVKVENCFRYDDRFVESVAFADGTEWDEAYLRRAARMYWGTEAGDIAKAYDQFWEENLMYGGAGSDSLIGGSNTNRINGGSGNDSIQGSTGEDFLYGGSGNDILWGNSGDDTLCGDTGNDHLYGGAGDDTYIFRFGDGTDLITESGGNDTLLFGEGISPEDLILSSNRDSVLIKNRINGDCVTLEYQLTREDWRIETVRTSDGSYIDYTKLELMIQAMASFEADTGMGWAQAMEERNAQALEIVNQWWVRDGK